MRGGTDCGGGREVGQGARALCPVGGGAALAGALPRQAQCRDLPARRGMVSGTDSGQLGQLTVNGQAPMAELAVYQTRLNAMTAGQGSYTLALSHYEAVPPAVQQRLGGQYKVQEE